MHLVIVWSGQAIRPYRTQSLLNSVYNLDYQKCHIWLLLQPLFWILFQIVAIQTLQSRTGPVQGQNRVFPEKFSTQGKTCFHYREPLFSLQGPLFSLQGFPCEKTSQGKPCFHYREWVCSETNQILTNDDA